MTFNKNWKTNWNLKSLTFEQLFSIIQDVIVKQLDDVEKNDIKLTTNIMAEYDADSVDIVAMLLSLEDVFKNASATERISVPTDKLGQITLVEDLLDIMYEVLVNIETKMSTFASIKPDFTNLAKRQK